MTGLTEVILEVHRSMVEARLPHAFGGAIALAYAVHEPRATADVDLNVFVDADEAERVLRALPEAVAWSAADVAVARREGQVRLWRGDVPLDLFLDYHELHRHAAEGTVRVPFSGTTIPVLAPDHLAVFKAFFDRTRDWADLEAMAEAGAFDIGGVRNWLVELLGSDDPRLARLDALTERAGKTPDPPPRLPPPT